MANARHLLGEVWRVHGIPLDPSGVRFARRTYEDALASGFASAAKLGMRWFADAKDNLGQEQWKPRALHEQGVRDRREIYWHGAQGSTLPKISKSFEQLVEMAGGTVEKNFHRNGDTVEAA